mgnify:CR=1 FL=1
MPTVTSKMVTSVQMSALQKSGIKFFVMGLANYGKGLRFCLFGGARTRGGAPLILGFFFPELDYIPLYAKISYQYLVHITCVPVPDGYVLSFIVY